MATSFRIGVDENGLGARLGPMIVTGVLARVDDAGARALARRLPKAIRADLDDSKRLVSHADYALGEAWARTLIDRPLKDPSELIAALVLDEHGYLSSRCPEHVKAQCWSVADERFHAEDSVCGRVERHRAALAERGIELIGVKSAVLCTKFLNDARARRINRFTADLHGMEALVLRFRSQAGNNVHAVCGKVGGIGQYGKFFGPLSGLLHTALEEGQKKSAYYFPTVGEVSFVRDADAQDPLVMLASLVGKYVRELLMARIVRFYPTDAEASSSASGYHDPITEAFVTRTALVRRKRRIPDPCFERERDAPEPSNCTTRDLP